jgi:hypothetical protein
MVSFLKRFLLSLAGSGKDLVPIILVVVSFQILVLQQPIPNLVEMLVGLTLVLLGLNFFINGLEMGLFPIGESMADDFARKGSLFWLIAFSFALGFGTTIAEPAIIAAAGNMIAQDQAAIDGYALGLRITVAVSVGFAISIGVIRILKGWPIQYLIIGGYMMVVIVTAFAPREIIGIAYDSGGVTTSTITVPLVTALGIGLASAIKGRNPMVDGFGLIAFASLTPIIFVMCYGMLVTGAS